VRAAPENRRILVIDDNNAIHADFQKILGRVEERQAIAAMERTLFGSSPEPMAAHLRFHIDSALQGKEGCELARMACQKGLPYAVAFVDMRMPPGWDGIETALELWRTDPQLQVVICTAYSDYSWEETVKRLGSTDRLLILKKPFETEEVRQIALSLTEKWAQSLDTSLQLAGLEQTLGTLNQRLQDCYGMQHQVAQLLREAEKLGELGQLMSGVVHEINNPLTFVLGNLDFLKRALRVKPEELVRELPQLRSVLRETAEGMERIRLIGHDLEGVGWPSREQAASLDVHSVLGESLQMASGEMEKIAEVVREFGPVPLVRANANRLTQVFLNLLVNAAQAFQPGNPDNRIILRTHRGSPDRVEVEISDTAGGIHPDNLAHLFKPFFTTKRAGAGSGLGLFICQQYLQAMDGEISVESVLGEGSTFRVSLKAADPS
jgi:two-component system, NtrC family, sensor kinase